MQTARSEHPHLLSPYRPRRLASDASTHEACMKPFQDPILMFIHIYITQIKRFPFCHAYSAHVLFQICRLPGRSIGTCLHHICPEGLPGTSTHEACMNHFQDPILMFMHSCIHISITQIKKKQPFCHAYSSHVLFELCRLPGRRSIGTCFPHICPEGVPGTSTHEAFINSFQDLILLFTFIYSLTPK